MKLEPEKIIDTTLKPGAIYKYEDIEALQTDIPHYFILINNKPKEEPILLLVCMSSQIEKTKARTKRRHQKDETLVILEKKVYKFLKRTQLLIVIIFI